MYYAFKRRLWRKSIIHASFGAILNVIDYPQKTILTLSQYIFCFLF